MENLPVQIGWVEILQKTLQFISRYGLKVLLLGLVAAFGRGMQEGAWGAISSIGFWGLEFVVEGVRLGLVILVIGNGSLKIGFRRVVAIFRAKKSDWKLIWTQFKKNVSANKIAILVNFALFLMIAALFNFSIHVGIEEGLLKYLKNNHIIDAMASKWPVVLWLKNVSIIPFTLIFETILILLLTAPSKP
ncbi:hypothetical protein P1X15_05210 [Runella sp. MFBS21]|uniref:hypothetical protein n=1 Tax=Runella sp. MFBS21 TaxID=3034018 RepID=UPI0023F68BD5|nr:hypothetical protein [Runella sp. MFBS21]MDF7816980.1 hypothetical protein [Runella sp. MFBS21]